MNVQAIDSMIPVNDAVKFCTDGIDGGLLNRVSHQIRAIDGISVGVPDKFSQDLMALVRCWIR